MFEGYENKWLHSFTLSFTIFMEVISFSVYSNQLILKAHKDNHYNKYIYTQHFIAIRKKSTADLSHSQTVMKSKF